jgi:asparagine synthase (glutamine-hydrolysing)
LQFDIDENKDERSIVTNLTALLEDATRIHLRSDVPLGAHLSGGIDSSLVVCIAANMLSEVEFKTFTGFFPDGASYDETYYAKQVSNWANTQYNEIKINQNDLATYLPKLMYYMDEPLAGPGVIPQYFVSKYAAQHVKVVLGGQGGDELFAGYTRYAIAYLEACLHGAISNTAKQGNYISDLQSMIPNLSVISSYIPMLKEFWSVGLFDSYDRRYYKLVNRAENLQGLFNIEDIDNGYSPFEKFQNIFNHNNIKSYINKMLYYDFKASLPALLHVEDRTSMAASIESRVPILDHKIVEYAASLPPKEKFANGQLKAILKKSVQGLLPEKVLNRKDKMGFPVPINSWMKNSSKKFVLDILFSKQAKERGLYNIDILKKHYDNEQVFGRATWGVLCLELWHRIFIDKDLSVGA